MLRIVAVLHLHQLRAVIRQHQRGYKNCFVCVDRFGETNSKYQEKIMPGCFGNSMEDRYFSRQLDRHLEAQEAHAAMIDRRAEDIYRAKLASLPVCYRTTPFGTRYLNLDDVIGDIFYGSSDDGVALACAVRDNNEAEAGRLLIKLLTNKLREDARDEAEDEA